MLDRWALAAFLIDYHSGQWSRGYRILSRMRLGGSWSPGVMAELRASECYAYLVDHYAGKV